MREVFGKRVKIVIDRFHVAKLYRKGLDTLRKHELQRLKKELSAEEYKQLQGVMWTLRKREAQVTLEDKEKFIGKYLSRLRKLNHVIAPKAGVETQLRAPRLPIPFGMRALGMTCEIRHSRLQGVIEPCHVSGLQGLDNPT